MIRPIVSAGACLAVIAALVGPVRPAHAGPAIPAADRMRIAEAFRLADTQGEQLWPGWYRAPFAVLLITPQLEYLVRHPRPVAEFDSLGYDSLLGSQVWSRPRRFDIHLLATFPAFGSTPIIVIGQAESTEARTPTRWVLTLLHEHLHQLQYSRSDYRVHVDSLHLARGDSTGMWMLNYPFPYTKPAVIRAFGRLDSAMIAALAQPGDAARVKAYLDAKRALRSLLSPADIRYMEFQLWQEGIARYTEVRMAGLASGDSAYAEQQARARRQIDRELLLPLDRAKRVIFYPLGAGEGLLLDRVNPRWREHYLDSMFSLEPLFTAR